MPEYRLSIEEIRQRLLATSESLAEITDELERLAAQLEAEGPPEEE
jgi:hypothetical protein